MIVQCDRCKAKYRLDDTRIPGKGVRITCPRCNNVFIILKDEIVKRRNHEPSSNVQEEKTSIQEDVRSEAKPARDEIPPPEEIDFKKVGIERWRIRSISGMVYNFTDIPTMKKFLSNRKVQPEESISPDGRKWTKFREIRDLDGYLIEVYRSTKAKIEQEMRRKEEIDKLIEERRKKRAAEEERKKEEESKLFEGVKKKDGIVFDIFTPPPKQKEKEKSINKMAEEEKRVSSSTMEKEKKGADIIPFRTSDGTMRSSITEAEVTIEEEVREEPGIESQFFKNQDRVSPTRDRIDQHLDLNGVRPRTPSVEKSEKKEEVPARMVTVRKNLFHEISPWMILISLGLLVLLAGVSGYLLNELNKGDIGIDSTEIEIPPLPLTTEGSMKEETKEDISVVSSAGKGVKDEERHPVFGAIEEGIDAGSIKEKMKQLYPNDIKQSQEVTRTRETVKKPVITPQKTKVVESRAAKHAVTKYGDLTPDILYNLAVDSLNKGHTDTAIEMLEELVKENPKNIEYQLKLSDAYIRARRFSRARSVLDLLIKKQPNNPRYLRMAGDLSMKMKDHSSAKGYYKKFLETQPDSEDAEKIRQILDGLEK